MRALTALLPLVLALTGPAPAWAGSDGAAAGPVPIEGGFAYRDVEFSVAPPHEALGTIVNRSGRTLQSACFFLKLYREKELLRVVDFCVRDFINGQSQVFRVETRTDPRRMTDFRIQYAGVR